MKLEPKVEDSTWVHPQPEVILPSLIPLVFERFLPISTLSLSPNVLPNVLLLESVYSVFQFKLESVIKYFRLQIPVLISIGKFKSLKNTRWADIVKRQEQSI